MDWPLGRLALTALLLNALAPSLDAQVEIPRLSEVIEVRVMNIDVVVTDRNGNRVHGLTKDDFEVYDGGKKQEITNLSEIVAHARPAAASVPGGAKQEQASADTSDDPPRYLVFFFDTLSTTNAERKRVMPAIQKLIDDLRPQDEATIVSWNRRMTIFAGPTNDRVKLSEALPRVQRELSREATNLTIFADRWDGGSTRAERSMMARRQIREAANDLTRSVRGLEQIVLRLAGVKGRKALILFSSAFSFRPGAEITGVDQAELDALFWAEDARAPQALDTLVRAANAAGVTIYTLHAKGLQSGISATDTGVNEPTGAFAPTLDRLRESGGSIDGLAYLAYRTGGLTAANVNFFTRAAERISEDLSSYYSIGYRAPVARNNEHRPIKVIARNKEYTVRARQGAVERSHETELADRVIASLLSAPKDNALGISAQVLRNDRTGRKRLSVPVDVKIPMAKLAFQSEREGGDLAADLSIFIASADSTGSMSSVAKFDQRVSVKRDQMATLAMKYYTYGMDVDLKTDTAENRFAIGVLDNLSKEVGLVTIDLPPATPKGK